MSDNSAGVGGLKLLKALVWVVYAVATAASIVLAFAFFLLMFGASTEAGFAEFIYTAAARFAEPFVGMVEPTELSNGGIVSWSALFAIVAYLVLAAIVGSILNSISRSIYAKSRPEPVQPAAVVPVVPVQPAQAPVQAPTAPAPAEPQQPAVPATVAQPVEPESAASEAATTPSDESDDPHAESPHSD